MEAGSLLRAPGVLRGTPIARRAAQHPAWVAAGGVAVLAVRSVAAWATRPVLVVSPTAASEATETLTRLRSAAHDAA